MKNLLFLLAVIIILCLDTTNAFTQDVDNNELPQKIAEELKNKFSKRAFIKNIEEARNEYEEMVVRLKRHTDGKGNYPYNFDVDLINSYSNTKDAYNEVIDSMITDINECKNIFQYHLFDANIRYKKQLEEAKKIGDEFLKSSENKLSGETKFIGKVVQWIIKIYPVLKKIENIYLEHVKAVLTDKLEQTKLKDWSNIE